MAKNKKSRRRPAQTTAVVAAGEELEQGRASTGDGSTAALAADGGRGGAGATLSNGHDAVRPGAGGTRLSLYKPGQGYYTRTCTAVATAVIAAFGAHYLYSSITASPAWQLGIPTVFLAVCGISIYWVVGLSRKTNDFFIATEGEMKKVSWSTRKEIIGSTKVVLVFTFLMAFLLFFVDILFMAFFSWIGVLDINLLEAIGWKVNG